MNEAKFQTEFNRWARNQSRESFVAELKITHTDYLSFSAVREHQERALRIAKNHALAYKIADVGMAQKPFDCFVAVGSPAYLVIMYYQRGVKDFYMIDIDVWLKEKKSSTRRSLTQERAAEIGLQYQLGNSQQFHPQSHQGG